MLKELGQAGATPDTFDAEFSKYWPPFFSQNTRTSECSFDDDRAKHVALHGQQVTLYHYGSPEGSSALVQPQAIERKIKKTFNDLMSAFY